MRAAQVPRLTIDDAFEILDKLGAERLERLILVGGQAAAFWIARYDVADPAQVTTRDIDVFISDDSGVAADCAKDLSGQLVAVRGPRVPEVAQVRFTSHGIEFAIDFLRSLHGISAADVVASKLGLADERVAGKIIYIMHPVVALVSRVLNTFELPDRLTEQNLARIEFSIRAARAYLMEQLSTATYTSEILGSVERIFELALTRSGLKAWHRHGIDLLEAVPSDDELSRCPRQFLEKRYPQLRGKIARKRKAPPAPDSARKSTRK